MAKESKETKVEPANWLYSTDGAKLGGKPFVVGTARQKIYGFIPTMASRSGLIVSMTDDLNALEAINEDNPLQLLTDYPHFVGLDILPSFQVVWNFLNGILPTWQPEKLSTLVDKYRVLYFGNYFDIPLKGADDFMDMYSELFVNGLIDEFKTATQQQIPQLMTMLSGMRNVIKNIAGTNLRIPQGSQLPQITTGGMPRLISIASKLPLYARNDMIYGPKDARLTNYREILPSVFGDYTFDNVKELKGPMVQMYNDKFEPMGIYEIKAVELLDENQVKTIPGIQEDNLNSLFPGRRGEYILGASPVSHTIVLTASFTKFIQIPTNPVMLFSRTNIPPQPWLAPGWKQNPNDKTQSVYLRIFSVA